MSGVYEKHYEMNYVAEFGVMGITAAPLPIYSSAAYNLIKRAYMTTAVPYSYPTKSWVYNVVYDEFGAVTLMLNAHGAWTSKGLDKRAPSSRQVAACIGRLIQSAMKTSDGMLHFDKIDEGPTWGCIPEFNVSEDEATIIRCALKREDSSALVKKFGEEKVLAAIGRPRDPLKAAYVKQLFEQLKDLYKRYEEAKKKFNEEHDVLRGGCRCSENEVKAFHERWSNEADSIRKMIKEA